MGLSHRWKESMVFFGGGILWLRPCLDVFYFYLNCYSLCISVLSGYLIDIEGHRSGYTIILKEIYRREREGKAEKEGGRERERERLREKERPSE